MWIPLRGDLVDNLGGLTRAVHLGIVNVDYWGILEKSQHSLNLGIECVEG